MNLEMILSSVIGFTPAVFLLYILLRRYEGLFSEKNIFLAFAAGMILGMLITVFHLAMDDFILSVLDLSLIVFVLLFAVMEEAAKLVILNIPKFHEKHTTVYYGAGLGLGIGSMAIIAISFRVFMEDPSSSKDVVTVAGLVLLSFNYSLLHSATGVMIGYGVAKKFVSKYFFRAVLFHALFNLILLPFMWGISGANVGALIIAAVYSAGLFYYVLTGLMPLAVPPDMIKKRRREKRKRARAKRSKD